MQAGLDTLYEEYEISLSLTNPAWSAFGVVDSAGFTAKIQNRFTPDYLTSIIGYGLQHTRNEGFTNSTSSSFVIPVLGASGTRAYGSSSKLVFYNLKKFFDRTGFWYIKWDEIRWFVDDIVEQTIGGGTRLWSEMFPVPSAVPIMGGFPIISGSSGVLFSALVLPNCDPGPPPPGWQDSGGTASSTAVGGFRVKDAAGWSEMEVLLPDGTTALSNQVPFESSSDKVNRWAYTIETFSGNWQGVLPAYDRRHTRMNLGYEALVSRGEMPYFPIKTHRYRDHTPCFPPGSSSIIDQNETTYTDAYNLAPQFLFTAGDSPHAAEEPTNRVAMAPFQRSTITSKSVGTGPGTLDQTVISLGPTMANGGHPTLAYEHPDWEAAFYNTWGCPFWSYWLWFPPDDAPDSKRWKIGGSAQDIDYFYQLRQQHITHPALPAADNTRKRTSIVTEPVTQNGTTGRSLQVLNLPCWWGISNFSVETEEFPTEFTTTEESEPRYSFWDGASPGTGSVDAGGIELTVGDAIEFDLASYIDFPFMATTLADRLKLPFSDANIGALRIYGVGADGEMAQIGDSPAVSDEVYRIPSGNSVKWATSAGIEFGAGYLADSYDPEAAVTADDLTSTVIGDEKTVSNLGLLPGFSPVRIRIEIDKVNPANPVTIEHPTFFMAPWEDAKVFHENGSVGTILFKNGPMVRIGALSYYDYFLDTELEVPYVADPVSFAPTIGDIWCWENNFLRGKNALDGLGARLDVEYEPGEEQNDLVKRLWLDPDQQIVTVSLVAQSDTKPELVYYNSFRNTPPMAMFPSRRRTKATGWRAEGEFGQWAYSLSVKKHPHIVPGAQQPKLMHDDLDQLDFESAPLGWQVGTFDLAVDGAEDQDFILRWNNTDWYGLRPWRGTANVLGLASEVNSYGVWHLSTRDGRFLMSWASESGAYVKWWDYHLPRGMSDTVPIIEGAGYYQCRLHDDGRNRIFAIISRDDSGPEVLESISDDGGRTWSTPMAVDITGGRFATNSSNEQDDRLVAAFVYDSGTSGPGKIKVLYGSAGDATLLGPVTVVDDAGSDLSFVAESFHMSFAKDMAQRVILSARIDGEADPSLWFCTDLLSGGASFTRFT